MTPRRPQWQQRSYAIKAEAVHLLCLSVEVLTEPWCSTDTLRGAEGGSEGERERDSRGGEERFKFKFQSVIARHIRLKQKRWLRGMSGRVEFKALLCVMAFFKLKKV